MSTFTHWTTSELLVLMEAIQYCGKMNKTGWKYVSELVKNTMAETGMMMEQKYNEYGCSSQYNEFMLNNNDCPKDQEYIDYAVALLRARRMQELEDEINERESRIAELKKELN